MRKKLIKIFEGWPKYYITTKDIRIFLDTDDNSLYSLLKRSVKEGLLIRLKREFFLISSKIKDKKPNSFEIAALLYGPSYISFESALSYHGWIPEAVPTITSSCSKKSVEFETYIGIFSYYHVPVSIFHLGIKNVYFEDSKAIIADPWKALADLIYIKKKKWKNIIALSNDMRIEIDIMQYSDIQPLLQLAQNYPNNRTKKILKNLYEDLSK